MVQFFRTLTILGTLAIVLCSHPSLAHASTAPDIRILDTEGNVLTVFSPYSESTSTIGSVAAADLGRDGIAEILVGSGEDSDPTVSVYRQDGSFIGSFFAYDVGYQGGVNVAACDVDDDGVTDIITGAAWNGGPHVRIFSSMGIAKSPGFLAFDSAFTGGINIACGDVTGDGVGDIIVGAGLGGGPNVKVFDASGKELASIFTDSATKNTGVSIALGDVTHDGVQDILTSTMGYEIPTITTWTFHDTQATLIPYSVTTSPQAQPTLIAPTGILNNAILFSTQGHTEPTLQRADGTFFIAPFSADATHAVATAIITESGSAKKIIAANVAPKMNDDHSAKSIRINKSHQRLTAYEYGVPAFTFLVSTAKQGYYTPVGKTTVRTKLLYHDYKWVFGIGDPRNYFVPNVKWNLRIYDHIYIHWAYWHNNFGNPMSHGCINMNAENSERIYEWSEVGTPVNIAE